MNNACPSQPLDDVADMLSGGTPRKSNKSYWNGSIPWLTPKDMGQWSGVTEAKVSPEAIGNGTRLAPEKAIFIAVRGMSLHNEIRVLRPAQAMTFNQDIKAIVARENIDPRYLFYVLLSKKPELLDAVEAAGHGTGRLPTDKLKDLLIPRFGSLTETAIAELFTALDRRIELNRRMNETLEAMAQAIFKDWFVDFGPTRAKAEGRAPYLAPDIWDLFPDALDDDDKPIGWSMERFGHYFKLEKGLSYKGKFLTQEGMPMINLGCFLGGGKFDEGKLKGYAGDHKARHTVAPGTLVVANTDMTQKRIILGSPHIVEESLDCDTFLFSHHVFAARPVAPNGDVWTRFFYFHLMQPTFRERAEGFATGTTVLALPRDAVEGLEFCMPPMPVYEAFLELVKPVIRRLSTNRAESRILAQTRDLLLPKLMSGEIRLSDAEKAVKAVA